MIRVVFESGEFIAEGHANFDEYGRDIVCAAVSAILQHSAYILASMGAKMEKGKGYLRVSGIPDSECAERVLTVTIESIRSIQREHPENVRLEVR